MKKLRYLILIWIVCSILSACAPRVQEETQSASVNPEFEGKAIAYGITIPTNAPHPDLAAELIRFLVGPEGQEVMAQNQHPMILPPVADNKAVLPEVPETLVP